MLGSAETASRIEPPALQVGLPRISKIPSVFPKPIQSSFDRRHPAYQLNNKLWKVHNSAPDLRCAIHIASNVSKTDPLLKNSVMITEVSMDIGHQGDQGSVLPDFQRTPPSSCYNPPPPLTTAPCHVPG